MRTDQRRRTRTCGAALAVAALACLVATTTAAPDQTQEQTPGQTAFRAGANLVSVFVTVVDDDGHLVTDLTKDDFEIRDNGRPQPLTHFSSDAQPFSAVVMLDRSGSMTSNSSVVAEATEAFIDQMRRDDRARIGSFSNEILLNPREFTSDPAALRQALEASLQDVGASPVWTAIDRSMTALLPMPDRRVVLAFTDGHDYPTYGQVRTRLDDLLRRTRVNGIMVYVIAFPAEMTQTNRPTFDPRRRGPIRIPLPVPLPGYPPGAPPGPGAPRGPSGPGSGGGYSFGKRYQPPDPGLRDLADESGGGYFEWDDEANLRDTFVRVAQELHQQYWLGFVPRVLDGRSHEIDVRVKRRGVKVRARQHYVATAPPRGR